MTYLKYNISDWSWIEKNCPNQDINIISLIELNSYILQEDILI